MGKQTKSSHKKVSLSPSHSHLYSFLQGPLTLIRDASLFILEFYLRPLSCLDGSNHHHHHQHGFFQQ